MFVECYKNNGIDYLRLVRSVRRPSKKDPSKMTSYKHTELSIGPLSRFDDGKPDYVKRLKQSFKDGKPLIDALVPYVSEPIVPENHGLADAKDLFATSFAHPRYCAQILLDPVFKSLGLADLIDLYAAVYIAVDKLEGQMRKLKTRLDRRHRENLGRAIAFENFEAETPSDNDEVVRVKDLELQPMELDVAITKMEALGHSFFIYIDSEDEKVSVVYRREDGGYGVLQVNSPTPQLN